jgi:hypothetical protein
MTLQKSAAAAAAASAQVADCFLTAAQTRVRYGHVSDMWLFRRLRDGSGFPQPLVVNKRRYWRLSELIAWERAASRTAGASA